MINDLKKIFTPADIVLIIILLFISGLFLWSIKNKFQAKEVEIYFHNELIEKCSMNDDRTIKLEVGISVEIKDGKVRMKESTCKNQFCVKQGWGDHFPIICVPNEVSIIIKSKKEEMLITR